MKARFLNSTGTLAERLMGSLMGAKVRGADTRCWNAGTSSISAFVRVVRPDDPPGGPYFFELNVDSMYGREPIDSLQTLFTQMKTQAFLRVDANTIDFGRTDVNVPYRDTTFVIRNAGGAADSIYIWIDYITVSPDSAATISPSALLLKPGESRALTFRIRPRLITQNGYYTMGSAKPTSKRLFSLRLGAHSLSEKNPAQCPKSLCLVRTTPIPSIPRQRSATACPIVRT